MKMKKGCPLVLALFLSLMMVFSPPSTVASLQGIVHVDAGGVEEQPEQASGENQDEGLGGNEDASILTPIFLTGSESDEDPGINDGASSLNFIALAGAESGGLVGDTSWFTGSGDEYILSTAAELFGLASLVNSGQNFSGITIRLGANIDLSTFTDEDGTDESIGTGAESDAAGLIGSNDGDSGDGGTDSDPSGDSGDGGTDSDPSGDSGGGTDSDQSGDSGDSGSDSEGLDSSSSPQVFAESGVLSGDSGQALAWAPSGHSYSSFFRGIGDDYQGLFGYVRRTALHNLTVAGSETGDSGTETDQSGDTGDSGTDSDPSDDTGDGGTDSDQSRDSGDSGTDSGQSGDSGDSGTDSDQSRDSGDGGTDSGQSGDSGDSGTDSDQSRDSGDNGTDSDPSDDTGDSGTDSDGGLDSGSSPQAFVENGVLSGGSGQPLPWTPIGISYTYPFQGTFDGDGYTISGLMVAGGDRNYQGLFGYAQAAAIRNLKVTGSVTGGSYVGGLVGMAISNSAENPSVIENVTADVNVTANVTVSGSGRFVGGIAGYAQRVEMKKVSAAGSISGGSYVGGLAGHLVQSSRIADSYATATVGGTTEGYVGGLVGRIAWGSVETSFYYNLNGVTAPDGVDTVGGVAGSGTTTNSYYLAAASGGAARDRDSFEYGEVLYLITRDSDSIHWEQEGSPHPVWAETPAAAPRIYRVEINGEAADGNSVAISPDASPDPAYHVFSTAGGQRTYVYDGTEVSLDVTCAPSNQVEFYPEDAVTVTDDGGNLTYAIHVDGADVSARYAFFTVVAGDTTWYDPDNPQPSYTLTTEAQLRGLSDLVSQGHTFAGIIIVLGNDIDLSGGNWVPIGGAALPGGEISSFNGTFDGGSRAIGGLLLNGGEYAALFGYTGADAAIKDLSVSGRVYATVSGGDLYVGGLVAYNQGSLEHVTNQAAVEASASSSGNVYVGGVAAYSTTRISSAGNDGAITTDIRAAYGYVGGVVGYAYEGMEDSSNDGAINAGIRGTSGGYAGGVAGYSRGPVSGSRNTGAITSNATGTGGVVGYLGSGSPAAQNTMANSYNTGPVKNTGVSGARLGGVAGYVPAYVRITHTYNTGGVNYASPNLRPEEIAGIAAASNFYVYLDDVYNQGEIESSTSISNQGALAGSSTASTGTNISNGYYREDCVTVNGTPRTPGDAANATAVGVGAFANGELAYTLKGYADSWTQGPGYPVFAAAAGQEVYRITLASAAGAAGGSFTMNAIAADVARGQTGYAVAGDTVELEVAPESGHVLRLLSIVRDGDGTIFASYNSAGAVTLSFTMPAEDLTVTAEFAAQPTEASEVTFDANGGAFSDGSGTRTATVPAGDKVAAPGEDPARDPLDAGDGDSIAYTFAGWYYEGLLQPFDFNTMITEDLTLYVKWTEYADFGRFRVTFDLNPGRDDADTSTVPDPQLLKNGRLVDKPEDPTWADTTAAGVVVETHRFLGWSREQTSDVYWNFETDTITTALDNEIAEITFYAQWETINVLASGTAGAPTAVDANVLQALAATVTAAQDYAGSYFELNGDIELSGSWSPIGSDLAPFNGHIEGNRHRITYHSQTGDSIFAKLGGSAAVENLCLAVTAGSSVSQFGPLATTNEGKIQNCNVEVELATATGSTPKGGIVSTNSTGGLIDTCVVLVSRSTNLAYFGGIVGTNNGTISNCRLAAGSQITGAFQNAGIASQNNGTISGCKVGGPDTATSISGSTFTAGIAGQNGKAEQSPATAKIEECVNYADISGTMMGRGGIVGIMNSGTVTQNENHGSVYADIGQAGGIVGIFGNGEITDNQNFGDVKSGNATSAMNVGGIVAAWSAVDGVVSHNSNFGDVRGGGASNRGVGGIVGALFSATASGTISYCYSTGDVAAANLATAGGILGQGPFTISNCYSTGSVSSNASAGAIAGGEAPVVDSCFWFGAAISGDSGSSVAGTGTATNTYYGFSGDEGSVDEENGAARLSAAAFASGEAAYLLDSEGGSENHLGIWTQDDTMGYPVLERQLSYYRIRTNGSAKYRPWPRFPGRQLLPPRS